jgi:hypothetical protein
VANSARKSLLPSRRADAGAAGDGHEEGHMLHPPTSRSYRRTTCSIHQHAGGGHEEDHMLHPPTCRRQDARAVAQRGGRVLSPLTRCACSGSSGRTSARDRSTEPPGLLRGFFVTEDAGQQRSGLPPYAYSLSGTYMPFPLFLFLERWSTGREESRSPLAT